MSVVWSMNVSQTKCLPSSDQYHLHIITTAVPLQSLQNSCVGGQRSRYGDRSLRRCCAQPKIRCEAEIAAVSRFCVVVLRMTCSRTLPARILVWNMWAHVFMYAWIGEKCLYVCHHSFIRRVLGLLFVWAFFVCGFRTDGRIGIALARNLLCVFFSLFSFNTLFTSGRTTVRLDYL